MAKFKWHSTQDTEIEEEAPIKKGGGRRVIPQSVLMKLAHQSHEGGTAVCEICHVQYAMTHIRWCKVAPFRFGNVCVWCKKAHGLVEG